MDIDPDELKNQTKNDLKATALRRFMRSGMLPFSIGAMANFSIADVHREICAKLDEVVRGVCRRLILVMPPRHGKSQLVSRHLPAMFLGLFPQNQVIATAYGFELVKSFSRDVRRIMESPAYLTAFGDILRQDSGAVERWETKQGGAYLAQGVGGSITGHGADLLICDDLLSNREQAESATQLAKVWDFFTGSLLTRLHPGGRVVLVMTRWSTGDPVGRILSGDDAGAWDVMHFPALSDDGAALWPERFSAEWLADTRRSVGAYDWESLYQGRPHARGGQYIKRGWFKRCKESELPQGLLWWRGVDLAATAKKTSDFTASVRVAEEKRGNETWYYIAGGLCARMEWPIAKRRIVELCKAERCRVCIEAVAGFIVAYREIADALRGTCLVREVPVSKDKLTRALSWIVAAEAGRVVIVESGRDDEWIETLLNQCDTFPSEGVHDDLIDAVSIAFEGGIYRKETSFAC